MPSERRNLTLSETDAELLDALCEMEGGVAGSAMVARSLQTRMHMIDVLLRMPRDERGRLARLCVLPEGVDPPPGAEVFRLYVPLLLRDGSAL